MQLMQLSSYFDDHSSNHHQHPDPDKGWWWGWSTCGGEWAQTTCTQVCSHWHARKASKGGVYAYMKILILNAKTWLEFAWKVCQD